MSVDLYLDLYSKCLDKWGTWSQMLMAMEEASEFIQACSKVMRTQVGAMVPIDRLAEETADLELMLDQVKYIFGLDKAVQDWRLKKIDRLEALLK